MAIHVTVSLDAALGEAVKCGVVYHACVKALLGLSQALTAAILRAPLRWVETMPIGRILNRLSADFATINSKLPGDPHMLLSSIFLVIITALTSLGISYFLVIPGAMLFAVTATVTDSYMGRVRLSDSSLPRIHRLWTYSRPYSQVSAPSAPMPEQTSIWRIRQTI